MDHVNKFILGTAQFGIPYGINNKSGKPSKKDTFEILDFAYENGIRMLDTAEAYGNAIEIIGNYHKEKINKKFEIITKLHLDENKDVETTISKSLLHLNIDSYYAFLFHSFEDIQKYPKALDTLNSLKNENLIKYLGASVYGNDEFLSAIEMPQIDLIQLPYNLLDNEAQRGNLLKKAKDNNKIIHTRSVFLQGLFFKDIKNLGDIKLKELIPGLTKIKMISDQNNISTEKLALQYTMGNKNIDAILIGIDNLSQLKANINVAKESGLNDDIRKQIDNICIENSELLYPTNWK